MTAEKKYTRRKVAELLFTKTRTLSPAKTTRRGYFSGLVDRAVEQLIKNTEIHPNTDGLAHTYTKDEAIHILQYLLDKFNSIDPSHRKQLQQGLKQEVFEESITHIQTEFLRSKDPN